ncbi:hypothetical protein [uncultured Prevotella sp.]|uniref:hypothetical protein n=1 Tax=uncultured Prevotella sp. TaxID=159272 RepID=UPI0027E2773D|nr:hypothetical protein [uncultured Prevotella sp.]
MKKGSVIMMGAALLVSSCTTGAGAGAYAGSSLGSVLGSAIGGIVGGPHGSDVGTIFGMAGGAVVGGALGDAAEKKQAQEQHEVLSRRNQRIQREKAQRRSAQQYDDDTYASGNSRSYSNGGNSANYVGDDFDPSQMVDNSNSGDDRIDFGAPSSSGANATMSNASSSQSVDASRVEQIYGNAKSDGKLTIRNVRFADSNGDGVLLGDEIGQVSFEIYNETAAPIYNFDPSVVEAEANKRIYISPSVRVENIMPGQGLRYTATVKADRRIKDGEIRLLVSAQKEGKPISYVTVVKVATQRQ